MKNMILSFFQKQESSKVEVTANQKEMEANGAMLVRILTTFVPKQFPNIKLQSLPGLIKWRYFDMNKKNTNLLLVLDLPHPTPP